MKRVLFVDDEPSVLEGLERMLFPLRKEWKVKFAGGGAEALAMMEKEPFDVLVTDMRMPGMDGATLLDKVVVLYPQVIRFVLTGQSDRETLFRSVGPAHQFMAKPCNPATLKSCVDRAVALRALLDNQVLSRIVSGMESLPSAPEVYGRLVKELRSPDASVSSVGRIIESDMAMTAKVLQLVNSAFFGLRRRVVSAGQAVGLLGLDTVKGLVLMTEVFARSTHFAPVGEFSLDRLWRHSLRVGVRAQAIYRSTGAEESEVKNAFTAGLLHDTGILAMAEGIPKFYREPMSIASAEHMPLAEIEQLSFGCTHAEVGAYLLGIWGLPDTLVEAVAFHHSPNACVAETVTPLTAVHLADAFDHEMAGDSYARGTSLVSMEYLLRIEALDRLDLWRDICAKLDEQSEASS